MSEEQPTEQGSQHHIQAGQKTGDGSSGLL